MTATGSFPSRRVSIIRNVNARRPPSDRDLAVAVDAISGAGWISTIADTTAPGDATTMARAAAADGVDVVAVCGGDGTINEAVNGLVGTETALAVVPGGTANVWAREVGISSNPTSALGLLSAGRWVRVDTGVARIGDEAGRHFLLMCSAGIDAEAVRAVELRPRLKRRLGRAAFGWPTARALFVGAPVDATIRIEGEDRTASLLMVLASNTRLYGSIMHLTDEALIDDGQLDLLMFEDVRRGFASRGAHRIGLVSRAFRGHLRSAQTRGIRYARTTEMEVQPRRDLPVQADGELIGTAGPDAPLRLHCAPGSLTVIVPGGVNPLFSRDGAR